MENTVEKETRWFHGIEHLKYEYSGYVYWRNIQVEHYSFDDEGREKKAAKKLAECCIHLESIGVEVNSSNVIWRWDRFEGVEKGDEWMNALVNVKQVWKKDDRVINIPLDEKYYLVYNPVHGRLYKAKFPDGSIDDGIYRWFSGRGFEYVKISNADDFKEFFTKNEVPIFRYFKPHTQERAEISIPYQGTIQVGKHLACGCCGDGFKIWDGYVDQGNDAGYGLCKGCQISVGGMIENMTDGK